MQRNYIVDCNEHKVVIACGPESETETKEWYPQSYSQSISEYLKIIENFLYYTNEKAWLLSCFNPYRKINLIERKMGITGVFRKQKLEYQGEVEKIFEQDGINTVLSVAEYNIFNQKVFFKTLQPQSIICIGSQITTDSLLNLGIENGLDAFKKSFFNLGNAIIQYNDVACDGNNITFHFDAKYFCPKELLNFLLSAGYTNIKE